MNIASKLFPKRIALACAIASLLGVSQLQAAEEAQTTNDQPSGGPAAKEGPTELSGIVVVGTRRHDRTVVDSAAPVDVLTGNELAAEPTGNMLDALSQKLPSFVVGQNAISDASSFVRSPSLRGLPADEMLVMLNGKRMNRSALVQVFQGGETELAFGSQGPDLASIPAISVKSLEVLRDGASAQYGSDAIAGVLNYQFRDASKGVEFTGRYGRYYPNSQWENDGDDGQFAVNFGLPLTSEGFVNVSAEYAKNDQTIRNVTRPSALAFAEVYPGLAAELPNYPGPVQQWGTPPSKSYKILVNSGLKLTDNSQVYFLANYAHIDTNESFNYRLPKTVTDPNSGLTFGHHPAFSDIFLDPCTAAYTGCPAGGFIRDNNVFNFASVYPAGFTPRFFGTTEQEFANLGYKGETSWGLNYDISGTTAQNSLEVSLRHSLNPSLGPASPTSFNDGKFEQREQTFNIDLTYPLAVSWLVNPLSIAGGFEWHNENYLQFLGDPASYAAGIYAFQPLYNCDASKACTPALNASGVQISANQSTASNGYGGISTPVDASQHNHAFYLDLEGDVLENLTFGIAGRYEDYSSFGTTTLGKFQVRWKLNDWIALRSTVSNGFHAPTPGQSGVETLSTTFVPGTANQVQIGTYPVTSSIAQYYGAKTLSPEKSTNYSVGMVLTPTDSFQATLDAYNIKVRDRIGISQSFNVTAADIVKLPALAYVGAGGTVQYFTNGFDTKTRGFDLVATQSMDLGPGRLDASLAYNYNKTTVPSFDPLVISQSRIVDIEHYAPNNRVNLSFDYKWRTFDIVLHENYYGSWRDENDYPGQLFGSKFTTDIDFAWHFNDIVTFAIGGKNIFNAYPDRIANSPANTVYTTTGGLIDGQVYPRTGGPFGFNGAFYYGRFDVKF